MEINLEKECSGHGEYHKNLIFSVGSFNDGIVTFKLFDITKAQITLIINNLIELLKEL